MPCGRCAPQLIATKIRLTVKFQTKVDSYGYPPDLETLVKGVEAQGGKKIRFLRSIPVDPINPAPIATIIGPLLVFL
jgi:hypothetical protein